MWDSFFFKDSWWFFSLVILFRCEIQFNNLVLMKLCHKPNGEMPIVDEVKW
jgi:hypothetical protein